jgi:hypothetical protein
MECKAAIWVRFRLTHIMNLPHAPTFAPWERKELCHEGSWMDCRAEPDPGRIGGQRLR